MWDLKNKTRYAAERSFVRDRNGAEVLLVAIKATYALDPHGSLAPADVQEPIAQGPEHAGDAADSPLVLESDFAFGKRATDVVVRGTAFAPRAERTIAMEVGLRVGPISKRVAVIGDRTWHKRGGDLVLGEPEPFVTMPLSYERAYGGEDEGEVEPRNPAGTGFATSLETLEGKRAPNLELPGALVPKAGDRPAPVGLGPIARAWEPRRSLAGTFDEAWQRSRMPLVPLDYDPRFEQCAPADQQVPGFLRGGEPIEIVGMSPSGGIVTSVPRARLRVRSRVAGEVVESATTMHTVRLDLETGRVMITWQAELLCHRTLYSLTRTVIDEVPE